MTDSTGFGETSAESAIENISSGGVTIHLCDTAVDYTDAAADIDTKSVTSEDVAEADLTITTPTGFEGVATLENDNDITYDVSENTETIVDVVIQNQTDGEEWALADEVNNPDLGENDEYRIDANTTLYELGNPT